MTATEQATEYLQGRVRYKLGRIDRIKRSVNTGIVLATATIILVTFGYLVWFALSK